MHLKTIYRFLLLLLCVVPILHAQWYLPVRLGNPDSIRLTSIGQFGLLRKERPTVKKHYHTGIDIVRPHQNYDNEPVRSIYNGTIISTRNDGPFSQIIIEHRLPEGTIWSVYEHLHVYINSTPVSVGAGEVIGRYLTTDELNKYGWQFDHLHFEVLKKQPSPLSSSCALPNRHFTTFAITCFTQEQLHERLFDPLLFFKLHCSR